MMVLLKIFICIVLLNACEGVNQKFNSSDSTVSINLNERKSYILPSQLDEISGHTFLPNNDEIVYCIQDENGIVFAYNLRTQLIEREIVFGPDGDYEGITNDGQNFYVLKSNGHVYSFPIKNDLELSEVKLFKNLVDKGEYESLAIDTLQKQLAILCKSCKVDRKKNHTTGYLLNYSSEANLSLHSTFTINYDQVNAINSTFPKVFEPSAMTKKYSTNEWYILSSIDKLLLRVDKDFMPIEVLPFSRKYYEQPEGIAFNSKEKLFISSEKGRESSAFLYEIQ